MGEGEGGGGQNKDQLGPPSPSSPPAEGRGDLVGICLFNYGLLSNWSVCSIWFVGSLRQFLIATRAFHPVSLTSLMVLSTIHRLYLFYP